MMHVNSYYVDLLLRVQMIGNVTRSMLLSSQSSASGGGSRSESALPLAFHGRQLLAGKRPLSFAEPVEHVAPGFGLLLLAERFCHDRGQTLAEALRSIPGPTEFLSAERDADLVHPRGRRLRFRPCHPTESRKSTSFGKAT